jgi:leucyl/phenylalanyl-tRNA--protein transferase
MFGTNRLTPELILRAYCMGIFPMGDNDGSIRWYSPDPRCILDLEKFHASRRLLRTYRHGQFELHVNSAWSEVLQCCAQRETTWITQQIFEAYTQLHELGLAHSVEAYKDGKLAGGLYGVSLGGAFMGESMFHKETDASKVCLVYLVERLKQRGFILLDCQFMTDHLATFGAMNLQRDEYLKRLQRALQLDCKFVD